MQDGTHTIERSGVVTSRVLSALYTELFDQRVDLAGTLLKPNMVLSGDQASNRAGADEVAAATLHTFYKHVLACSAPGIVFLSGGQSDEDATAHLNAMNATGPHPWQLSFSYGRALQAPALKAWGGKEENVEAGAARVLPPREDELRRAHGHVRARDGAGARDRVKLTDAGLETVLVFEDGIDLPAIRCVSARRHRRGPRRAAPLLHAVPRARPRPRRAARALDPDLACESRLGRCARLRRRRARRDQPSRGRVRARTRAATAGIVVTIEGLIGPRSDGYAPTLIMDADEAEQYHAVQIGTFADAGCDQVSALTLGYPDEAIGVVRAAKAAGIPSRHRLHGRNGWTAAERRLARRRDRCRRRRDGRERRSAT